MSGCVRKFNAKHIRFGVAQPGGGQRLLGFVRPVHDETGQPLVSGRSGETGKDIHFRITEDLGDMRERAGAILMGKRELACSCHTPVLIGNWVRSGTGGPSPQGVLHSERLETALRRGDSHKIVLPVRGLVNQKMAFTSEAGTNEKDRG